MTPHETHHSIARGAVTLVGLTTTSEVRDLNFRHDPVFHPDHGESSYGTEYQGLARKDHGLKEPALKFRVLRLRRRRILSSIIINSYGVNVAIQPLVHIPHAVLGTVSPVVESAIATA